MLYQTKQSAQGSTKREDGHDVWILASGELYGDKSGYFASVPRRRPLTKLTNVPMTEARRKLPEKS
jgi:hypothetical protein